MKKKIIIRKLGNLGEMCFEIFGDFHECICSEATTELMMSHTASAGNTALLEDNMDRISQANSFKSRIQRSSFTITVLHHLFIISSPIPSILLVPISPKYVHVAMSHCILSSIPHGDQNGFLTTGCKNYTQIKMSYFLFKKEKLSVKVYTSIMAHYYISLFLTYRIHFCWAEWWQLVF